jgi:hypothetical protein
MSSIFSRPFRLHLGRDTIQINDEMLFFLLNSFEGLRQRLFPGLTYGEIRMQNFNTNIIRLLRRLAALDNTGNHVISTGQLLGLLVRTGLLAKAKKVGRFLAKVRGDISILSDQALLELKKILMYPANPRKSLLLGFCVLAVLFTDRPMERMTELEKTHVRHIWRMMEHSFFRPDVVAVLTRWHDVHYTMIQPPFSQTPAQFDEMFAIYRTRISWFLVMCDEILQAPPPQPPPPQLPPIVQPPIEDIIV